jgi:MoxR-like ATPase
MEGITKDELLNFAENSNNTLIQTLAKQKMQDEFAGDIVAQKMIQLSQLLGQSSGGSSLDEEEVKRIVREEIETDKITFEDLDDTVKKLLSNQTANVTLNVTKGGVVTVVKLALDPEFKRPLIQKMLSDVLARNNVYLYGGAGTGKSYSANILKKILGWDVIEISCSQFTSALEIIGGQTIDGYQEGKVVRAFGNLDKNGNPTGRGCILLLDELPKIDPNTAGMLNSVLARVGEYKDGIASTIQNARGDVIERGECFIMATGNALLNTKDPDYEANFKQDLSLQDRFAGSTYKVVVDIEGEWEGILNKKWAFIFIYLNKLRKAIQQEGFLSKAFVSIRLIMSVQKTYNVFRQVKENAGNVKSFKQDEEVSYTPVINERGLGIIEASQVKTVKDSMDEFFSLFTTEQSDILKSKTDYEGWLRIVNEKNKIPMDKLNTPSELEEVKEIIKNK